MARGAEGWYRIAIKEDENHPKFEKAEDEGPPPIDRILQEKPTERHPSLRPSGTDMMHVDHSTVLKSINNGEISLENVDPLDEIFYTIVERAQQAVTHTCDEKHFYRKLAKSL